MRESESRVKIIFAGTPEFALPALTALIHSSHELIAVYTQPDKPAGRGLRLAESPVKTFALQHHLPLYQPASLRQDAVIAEITRLTPDVIVVAAYGLLVPSVILALPRFGCINIHPSLLPRWRGAAPIERTIEAGDTLSGVTIMQMDAGLDTGPILLQRSYELTQTETASMLYDALSRFGATLLVEAIDLLAAGKMIARTQDGAYATYAKKLDKLEAHLDWSKSAIELERMIRAFNPWPIAFTIFQGEPLRIGQASVMQGNASSLPGTIVSVSKAGIEVATGQGVLQILTVQLPGRRMITVADFYNANRDWLKAGMQFD
ncbi:MAG: methionyl-tRNA formyltransferase [Gammaproteobacteria bacterium RIFCSPHIGHO2_12_FULL_42_10]|nr:MAG: methionyl-tRNA formyltransferase [Gammaproteobacteria bacterium RIFCSPHIGHO2_12_FULL_42_10]